MGERCGLVDLHRKRLSRRARHDVYAKIAAKFAAGTVVNGSETPYIQ
jgi:hypothetical protein